MNRPINSSILFFLSFSFIISKTHFLRKLEDLVIESASFSNQCITNFDEFKLTVTYPSNYTITNQEIFDFGEGKLEQSLVLTNVGSTQTVTVKTTAEENSSSRRLEAENNIDFGNYTLKSLKANDTVTFNITQLSPVSFCYTQCCLITNTSETLLIKKGDQDKLAFILNLDGACDDIGSTSKLVIQAVNTKDPTNPISITNFCERKERTNNDKKFFIQCTIPKEKEPLPGGEDDNKPSTYKIQFKGKSCEGENDQYIDTKIQINVVSGNYLILNKVIACVLFILLI